MTSKGCFSLLPAVLLLVFMSCATSVPEAPSVDLEFLPPRPAVLWEESGVTGLRILQFESETDPVGVAALAVDLTAPGVSFFLTPPDPGGKGDTRSAKVSVFASEYNLTAAINAAPFYPVDLLNRQKLPCDISGIHIYEGVMISRPEKRFDALYILEDGTILLGSQEEIPEDSRWAVGGFHLVLQGGENRGMKDARHPRSAAGVSEDGKTLYLAAFEGRMVSRAGLTTWELGEWMRWLGASDALNLDGGGASALVLRQTDGSYSVLNTPVHRGKPGLERVVASHLGILIEESFPE